MSNQIAKSTYIVTSSVFQILCLVLAVFAPIYVTPGYYWWSVFAVVLFFLASFGCTARINSWGDMGEVGNGRR